MSVLLCEKLLMVAGHLPGLACGACRVLLLGGRDVIDCPLCGGIRAPPPERAAGDVSLGVTGLNDSLD